MLIRRRISVLQQLIEEYDVNAEIKLFPSEDNLADVLTRVRSRWINKLTVPEHRNNWIGVAVVGAKSISDIHKRFCSESNVYFVCKAILTAIENDV